jgi:hypothetical protein
MESCPFDALDRIVVALAFLDAVFVLLIALLAGVLVNAFVERGGWQRGAARSAVNDVREG